MHSILVDSFDALNAELVACSRCPRLVKWREQAGAQPRASFRGQAYWSKPAPNFGDPLATRLIVGLAPAAHGANRTGRMFTGDRSGDFLFSALKQVGLANQSESTGVGDGLVLTGVIITAAVHCAPPGNKPSLDEEANCRPYLLRLVESRHWESVLCLGGLAWAATFDAFKALGGAFGARPRFGHGVQLKLPCRTRLVGSYHPSQQNTFTGRLTAEMMANVLGAFLGPDERTY